MRLLRALRRRIRREQGPSRLRLCVTTLLVVCMVGRPVRLASVRWWRSPDVAASISLTTAQREAIDRIYERRSAGRRRCVERLVEASNKVDEFIRDGVYDENVLKQTEAVAGAATEERIVTRLLSDEIVALLSPPQRERLRVMLHERIVE
jgi:hypothetical protein